MQRRGNARLYRVARYCDLWGRHFGLYRGGGSDSRCKNPMDRNREEASITSAGAGKYYGR